MRKGCVPITILLISGAIVNVAVAWACAAWISMVDAEGTLRPIAPDAQTRQIDWIQSRFGHRRINRIVIADNAGEMWDRPYGWRDAMRHQDGREVSRSEDFAGWPMRSITCVHYGFVGSRSPMIAAGIGLAPHVGMEGGIELPQWPGVVGEETWRALPLRPVWRGFVLNTLFYAAILWCAFILPGKIRRQLRRRRMQCPACAYPIGTSPVCTECGGAVQRINRQ